MMNRTTGRTIGDADHLRQSVADILTTPIGSRVMRRSYGSLVPALIDQPHNRALAGRVCAAAASALMRWEPRISLQRVRTLRDPTRPGFAEIEITGTYNTEFGQPKPLRLNVPVAQGATA